MPGANRRYVPGYIWHITQPLFVADRKRSAESTCAELARLRDSLGTDRHSSLWLDVDRIKLFKFELLVNGNQL